MACAAQREGYVYPPVNGGIGKFAWGKEAVRQAKLKQKLVHQVVVKKQGFVVICVSGVNGAVAKVKM